VCFYHNGIDPAKQKRQKKQKQKQKRQKKQKERQYIAPQAAYCNYSGAACASQTQPVYSLGRSITTRLQTLACSHSAKRSPSLPFNGLHPVIVRGMEG